MLTKANRQRKKRERLKTGLVQQRICRSVVSTLRFSFASYLAIVVAVVVIVVGGGVVALFVRPS